MNQNLGLHLQSGVPLIYVQTREVERAIPEIGRYISQDFNAKLAKLPDINEFLKRNGLAVKVWSNLTGWGDSRDGVPAPTDALAPMLEESNGRAAAVYIIPNFHLHWDDIGFKPLFVQQIVNIIKDRKPYRYAVFVGTTALPLEVRHLFAVTDLELPSEDRLSELIKTKFQPMITSKLKDSEVKTLSQSALGLTLYEAERFLRASVVKSNRKTIDAKYILSSKAELIKSNGYLEYLPTDIDQNEVGGLFSLKEWAKLIKAIYDDPERAAKYGLNNPKGCLLTGVNGCGKTRFAKALSNWFGLPLYRLDIGKLMGGLVGETEANTRELFKTLDALGDSIILLDEIEKMFAGFKSSYRTSSGVEARMMGAFLYYLQEKTNRSFFIATANDVSELPPEFLRKGRWNEIWFVDLPSEDERREIFKIHLAKVGRDPKGFNLKELAKQSEQFTGAEIESVIQESLAIAFTEDREITTKDISALLPHTPIIAKTKESEIAALRRWASGKARLANAAQTKNEAWWRTSNVIILEQDEKTA